MSDAVLKVVNVSLFSIYRPFSRWTWVSWYHASILDFIWAKDDGCDGDNWRCKTCRTPVKSSL